ncbi:MAG: nucleoside monophosphate kinase, partial [Clostridia bacterium]|nr:nucleoside monophosphate kinase [Clostridia bacterium]
MKKLIFLGAPGAGKGTQAARISAALAIPAISTGDIIREAIKSGSPLGLEFKRYTDAGKLVPDSLVVTLLQNRINQADCANGFILDGFPRTLEQARYLDESGTIIDCVINISVSDESIVNRMSGRRFCPQCQKTYHIRYNKPQVEGICDTCKIPLSIREDDKPETVLQRLKVYHEQT